jgi:2-dehydro-3-deoxyphosphooctonate aldolase (KDO 8-P synthase)
MVLPHVDGHAIGALRLGGGAPLLLIAGPCAIESREHTLRLAGILVELAARHGIPLLFKASFDKANRTRHDSFRGPGLDEGLRTLDEVRRATGLPLLTDVHEPTQTAAAAQVVDVLQVPAFLCRQTDLVAACAATGKPVNLKKGQFIAPEDARHLVDKARSFGATAVSLTERGFSFGYHNLVVDMRGLATMRALGAPVIFDATHSVQLPGAAGGSSGGERQHVATLARAAVAVGVDGLYVEVHDEPERARSDGPNALTPAMLDAMLPELLAIDRVIRG